MMIILASILIGAAGGALSSVVIQRDPNTRGPAIVVGILGGLLGLGTHAGMGSEGMIEIASCEYIASALGALLALFLWSVAQRLFLAPPVEG